MAIEGAPNTTRRVVLFYMLDPISGWTDFRVGKLLKRKDNSSQAPDDISIFPNIVVHHYVPVQEY